MPRTKAVRKKPTKQCEFAAELLPLIENDYKKYLAIEMEQTINSFMRQFKTHLEASKFSIPNHIVSKTIGELMELPPDWSGTCTSVSTVQILDATKILTEKKKKSRVTRSSSLVDDEGYLTAESSKSTSGRQSRARTRIQKSTRISRSLSTRAPASSNRYKTPAQRIPQNSYGTVTPKVKPNTPQVLLRRPKLGEVALSLQGSPLLTGSVMTDNVANINIPLEDGRLLSIQPQRGLRISQIPHLDLETKRQLETLRDNLNKVCALSCKR